MAHQTPEFKQLVREKINEWKIPGLSLAVIQGEEIHTQVLEIFAYAMKFHSFIHLGLRICNTSERKGYD